MSADALTGRSEAVDTVHPARLPVYLGQFDTYRIVACSAVVFQHSLLWTLAAGNVAGWAFVMLLHFSRTAFFFLSAFVLTYAQITRPRGARAFWKRRYLQLGVPYLAWTVIYWLYTVLDQTRPAYGPWTVFWHDFLYGYYQLYVVAVLFQLYLVFPLVFWVLRKTGHHLLVMAASLGFALALAFAIHWPGALGPVGRAVVGVERYWPWSRNVFTYQEQFVAGILVAMHYEQVHRFLARWYRVVVGAAAVVGLGATLWYLGAVWSGAGTGFASDIYQPVAFLWFTAVVAALECMTWRWFQRSTGRGGTAWSSSLAPRLADLTGGVFLCHVLLINLMRALLRATGIIGHLGWAGSVLVLFVLTMASSVLFVSLVLRTPLAWVLGGPARAEQRARLAAPPAEVGSMSDRSPIPAAFGVRQG